ncbi:MAG: hypothetical protein PHT33_10650 [bacterium]|nr:hypothetical protein [bacterium]
MTTTFAEHIFSAEVFAKLDIRLKLASWLLLFLLLIITTDVMVYTTITLALLAMTVAVAANGGRVRSGYGRGMLIMMLSGLFFNVLSVALRHDGFLPGHGELMSLWRLLLLVWSTLILNSLVNPARLMETLGNWLSTRRLPLSELPLIMCNAVSLLPEVYDRGVTLLGERFVARTGYNKLALLVEIPDILTELLLFSLARAEALTEAEEVFETSRG